jgi:protein-S-isoprenylcysteine O-methyltransferase Ste14
MTYVTKWLVAVPFVAVVALAIPGWVTGDWAWPLSGWAEALFSVLTVGMWLAATAFVDVGRPRQPVDLPRLMITAGLLLAVPVAVFDRVHGAESAVGLSVAGLVLCVAALALGLAARRSLGPAYSPHSTASPGQSLVTRGPYRWVRHPLYAAALLWAAGWPLILSSVWGAGVAAGLVTPAVLLRIRVEEALLLEKHGQAFAEYQHRSWRLLPFLY